MRDGSNIPPTDEELRKWGMTRAQSDEMVGQLWARRDATLTRTGSGVYWVALNFSATTHMSFSDLPVLAAGDSAEADRQTRVLSALNLYIRSFFDKTLRCAATPLLDQGSGGEFVYLVKSYPPTRRR